MLNLHALFDLPSQVFGSQQIGIGGLTGSQDRASFIQKGHDLGISGTAILGLYMEYASLVSKIMIVSADHGILTIARE
jgi:hypothetical protein